MTLIVSDLRVSIEGVPILNGIDFELPGTGERVGIVGESGSGKSMTARALIGLLPRGAEVSGRVDLDGENLLTKTDKEMNAVRGKRIAMMFQDSMTSLDPLMTIVRHFGLPLRHRALSREEMRAEATRLLERVQLDHAQDRLSSYPHQLSGGQRQRVSLAMALAGEPDLLIVDEPTTALDVTVKAEVIKLLRATAEGSELDLVVISHDLPVIAYVCERILVMYGGVIVEEGGTDDVLKNPRHRYTAALVESMPSVGQQRGPDGRLSAIPGSVPSAGDFPSGCPFRTRCEAATDACQAMPPMDEGPRSHRFACWHPVSDL